MSDKIELKEKLAAVDLGVKNLWDDLDDIQRKALKSEFFILNRYVSSVKTSNRDVKEHYILAVNEFFNKYWNDLQKHPKLMWLLLSMCGHESKQIFYHEWVGFKKKEQSSSKMTKFLNEIYSDKKDDEIELLAKLTTKEEAKNMARDLGYNESEIAKMF
jgi:hypothetical protein